MLHIICLLDSETPTATDTDKVKPDSQVQPLEPCMEDYMVVYASHPGMNIYNHNSSFYHNNSNSHCLRNLKQCLLEMV